MSDGAIYTCGTCGRSFPTHEYAVDDPDGVTRTKIFEPGHRCLRDEFAMAALPIYAEQSGDMTCDELADQCYAVADAMLEARKVTT